MRYCSAGPSAALGMTFLLLFRDEMSFFGLLSDGGGLGELNPCFFVSSDDLLGFIGFYLR